MDRVIVGRGWRPRGRGVGVGITPVMRRKDERRSPLGVALAWVLAGGASQVDRRRPYDHPAEAGTHVGVAWVWVLAGGALQVERRGPCDHRQKLAPTWAWAWASRPAVRRWGQAPQSM